MFHHKEQGLQHYRFIGVIHLYRLFGMGRQIWSIFLVQNDYRNMDKKFELFRKEENRVFRLIQNLTMGEAIFNYFKQLRIQLVVAEKNSGKEENLSPVLIQTMSKDMEEQLKLTPKVLDVVDYPYKKDCLNLLHNNVDKPWSSYARI